MLPRVGCDNSEGLALSQNRLLVRLLAPEGRRSWASAVVRRITPLAGVYSIFIVGEEDEVRKEGSLARRRTGSLR